MSEHTHTYTHDHEGGDREHTHEHDLHDHDHHAHDHDHHSHEVPGNRDQIEALLDYTVRHNRSHEDELSKLSDKLRGLGCDDAAAKVEEAAGYFDRGNELLEAALKLIRVK